MHCGGATRRWRPGRPASCRGWPEPSEKRSVVCLRTCVGATRRSAARCAATTSAAGSAASTDGGSGSLCSATTSRELRGRRTDVSKVKKLTPGAVAHIYRTGGGIGDALGQHIVPCDKTNLHIRDL